MDKGQYTITLNHEQGLIYLVAQGEFNFETAGELITDARQQAAEHQYSIFCDARESTAKVNLADWYYLPRRLFVYRDLKTRRVKTAILVREGRQENAYRFFETVANNLGLRIKVFLREEEALEWLGGRSK
jgi:sulfur relay (sulfurtransferase) DsrF/TusC family protein